MVTLSKSISMAALGAWAGGSNWEELPRSLPEIGWFTALSVHSPGLVSTLACHFPASGKRKGAEEANPSREMDVVAIAGHSRWPPIIVSLFLSREVVVRLG